jgi:hypothetical protein
MNNIRIYAFFWMIVLLTVSCYEDKGNYDYQFSFLIQAIF